MDLNYNLTGKLFSFIYGSKVYGTAGPYSDTDMFIVCKDDSPIFENDLYKEIEVECTDKLIDAHIISESLFIKRLDDCDVKSVECIWQDPKFFDNYEGFVSCIKEHNYSIDLTKIRKSISAVCSNSWVKCKKKLTVEKDYNPYIAKKSLWHVLRLYMYGEQIGRLGKIEDYECANIYYDDIMTMPDDWEVIKEKYQPIRNELHHKFVNVCPKEV